MARGSCSVAFTRRCFRMKPPPTEPRTRWCAVTVIVIWPQVIVDCLAGRPCAIYDGGRVTANEFASARWDLLPQGRYMWASVQTVRGCPKHCSFCSVWRTDGQEPRQRGVDRVVREIVELRRLGFRFIALADDNFYPVTFERSRHRRGDVATRRGCSNWRRCAHERFELMARLARLPDDLVFYTQITMEAAEDPVFLDAMRRAHIRGALVGVESVTADGLKDVYKGFNLAGDELVARLREFRASRHPRPRFVHLRAAERRQRHLRRDGRARASGPTSTFAQFVLLTPFPGTVDFEKWAADENRRGERSTACPSPSTGSFPRTSRPRLYAAPDDVARGDPDGTQRAWDQFYSWRHVWARSRVVESSSARDRVHVDLEAVPADVREHRDRDRQRARGAIGTVGAMDWLRVPAAVPWQTDATPWDSRRRTRRVDT